MIRLYGLAWPLTRANQRDPFEDVRMLVRFNPMPDFESRQACTVEVQYDHLIGCEYLHVRRDGRFLWSQQLIRGSVRSMGGVPFAVWFEEWVERARNSGQLTPKPDWSLH